MSQLLHVLQILQYNFCLSTCLSQQQIYIYISLSFFRKMNKANNFYANLAKSHKIKVLEQKIMNRKIHHTLTQSDTKQKQSFSNAASPLTNKLSIVGKDSSPAKKIFESKLENLTNQTEIDCATLLTEDNICRRTRSTLILRSVREKEKKDGAKQSPTKKTRYVQIQNNLSQIGQKIIEMKKDLKIRKESKKNAEKQVFRSSKTQTTDQEPEKSRAILKTEYSRSKCKDKVGKIIKNFSLTQEIQESDLVSTRTSSIKRNTSIKSVVTNKELSSLEEFKIALKAKHDLRAKKEEQKIVCPLIKEEPRSQSNIENNYYIDRVIKDSKKTVSVAYAHLESGINFFYRLAKIHEEVIRPNKPLNPVKMEVKDSSKKLLVLDLDETLIHCSPLSANQDFRIQITLNNVKQNASIKVRPHAKDFLRKISEFFNVVVFTASQPNYANTIIDYLDPQRLYIQKRFYREHCCILSTSIHYKDLSIFGHDLSQVLLVDNSHHCFCKNIENGVPILPFYGSDDDIELQSLYEYLIGLKDVEDVRAINSKIFQFEKYSNYRGNTHQLVQELYSKKEFL